LPELPTATHDPLGGQNRPATAPKPGGGCAADHVLPPSLLVRNTGADIPVPVAPTAMHVEAHETSEMAAVAAGSFTAVNELPPFVVTMASPGRLGLNVPAGLEPTATQSELVEQLMEKS
jgi:hypothetical protein